MSTIITNGLKSTSLLTRGFGFKPVDRVHTSVIRIDYSRDTVRVDYGRDIIRIPKGD